MNDNKTRSGIGFTGALQVAFIVLKLCKVIDWSWLWVLSPIWISMAILLVCIIIATFIVIGEKKEEKKYWDDRLKRRGLLKDDTPDKETKDV